MSKISISVDTAEKSIAVEVDGEAVANVHEVSVYGGDYFGISVAQVEKSGDMTKVTRLYAYGSEQAEAALSSGEGKKSHRYPGFVEVVENQLDEDKLEKLWSEILAAGRR